MSDSIREILLSHSLFHDIKDFEPGVLESLRKKRLKKNEVLYRPGSDVLFAYLIVSGSVKFDFSLSSGVESFVGILGKGYIIGELEIFSGFAYQSTATANEDADLLLIPREVLFSWIKNNSEFSFKFIKQQSANFYFYQLLSAERMTSNLKSKLANELMSLSLRFGKKNNEDLSISISHQELSEMINASRQRVNQQLNQWQKEGIVFCDYGVITILDVEKLKKESSLANSFIGQEDIAPYQE